MRPLIIQLARKDLKELKSILNDAGIEDPTMVVTEVKHVYGKIKDRIN